MFLAAFGKVTRKTEAHIVKLSLRTIADVLARIIASSEKSFCCTALLTIPWMPFLKIITTFCRHFVLEPLECMFWNNEFLSLVLFTFLWIPIALSRLTYSECSSESKNINFSFSTIFKQLSEGLGSFNFVVIFNTWLLQFCGRVSRVCHAFQMIFCLSSNQIYPRNPR